MAVSTLSPQAAAFTLLRIREGYTGGDVSDLIVQFRQLVEVLRKSLDDPDLHTNNEELEGMCTEGHRQQAIAEWNAACRSSKQAARRALAAMESHRKAAGASYERIGASLVAVNRVRKAVGLQPRLKAA